MRQRGWKSRRAGRGVRVGRDPEGADRRLLEQLDRDFAEARKLAGEWLRCAPGCSDCCYGPFPITRLDVWRLRRGRDALATSDPARSRRLAERVGEAVRRLAPGYPGDPRSGRLLEEEEALDRFFRAHAALACPALEESSGLCELYAHRPVACRTFGPPVRFGAEDSPPCKLCFVGAPERAIAACRVEPDREGLEEAVLARLGAAGAGDWETLVAFALR